MSSLTPRDLANALADEMLRHAEGSTKKIGPGGAVEVDLYGDVQVILRVTREGVTVSFSVRRVLSQKARFCEAHRLYEKAFLVVAQRVLCVSVAGTN